MTADYLRSTWHVKCGSGCRQVQTLVDRLPFKVQRPPQQAILTQSAVFGALAAWSLLQARMHAFFATVTAYAMLLLSIGLACQGLTEPPNVQSSSVPSLQIALALGASVYFLRDGKSLPLRECLLVVLQSF